MTRLLIVDDEKSIRLTTAAFLEAARHNVRTAANKAEAMAIVDDRDFDVAIVDIQLGPDNGIAVAKVIRDQRPNTQIIFATGEPEVRSAREVIHLHTFDYLAKPFLGSVMIRIRRAIACCGCATCSLRWIESNTCGVVLPTEAAW